MKPLAGVLALSLLSTVLMAQAAPEGEGEGEHLATSSKEFDQSRDAVLEDLRKEGFTRRLLSAGRGATSSDQARKASAQVKKGAQVPGVEVGDAKTAYDVILQPGHYGRTTGATGASGVLVSEKEIVAYIVGSVAEKLRAQGYKVVVVPADNVLAKNAKIFLAVHAEGSESKCSAGPSLAYKQGNTPYAMHAIGLGLSRAMGYNYKDFRADGYTKNSAQYYMYNKVNADKLTGLLEIGEITCVHTEEKLLNNVNFVSSNLATSLDFILRLD